MNAVFTMYAPIYIAKRKHTGWANLNMIMKSSLLVKPYASVNTLESSSSMMMIINNSVKRGSYRVIDYGQQCKLSRHYLVQA